MATFTARASDGLMTIGSIKMYDASQIAAYVINDSTPTIATVYFVNPSIAPLVLIKSELEAYLATTGLMIAELPFYCGSGQRLGHVYLAGMGGNSPMQLISHYFVGDGAGLVSVYFNFISLQGIYMKLSEMVAEYTAESLTAP